MKKTDSWKGYDRQELKIKQAINAVKLEIAKENLAQKIGGVGESSPVKIGSYLINNPKMILRMVTIVTTIFSIYKRIFGKK